MDYHNIYSIGYSLKGSQETLTGLVNEGAIMVDIRLKPASRWATQYNKSAMIARYYEKSVYGKYCHVEDLGNTSYLIPGKITLKNAKAGIPLVLSFLEERDVILLCACKDWSLCHRHEVVNELLKCEHGLKALHFNRSPDADYNVLSVWENEEVVNSFSFMDRLP